MRKAQKKQIAEQLKNRLNKTFILTFNKLESVFKEDEKIDPVSGATDRWGKNFSPGEQYKNVKTLMFCKTDRQGFSMNINSFNF